MAIAELRTFLRTAMSHGMQDGADAVAGQGQKWWATYTGTAPASGDTFKISLVDGESAAQVEVGAGDGTLVAPTFCFSYNNKTYILAGPQALFSAVGEPTVFNDPDGVGNGFVDMTSQLPLPEDLVAMAPFQGKLAFFTRRSIQIWQVDADPNAWALHQTLSNIGSIAKLSVVPMGEGMDVLFLSDTGVRALQVREGSLNSRVDDNGSPIDALIQAQLISSIAIGQAACAVVEPISGRYMLYLGGVIYVRSYYESSKVLAWSTYEPKDSAGATFVPTRFIVFQGQVYARAGNNLYRYGGTDNNTYDATVATWELPWLDLKTPGKMKNAKAVNAAYSGAWTIGIGMDPVSGNLETPVWAGGNYTYDKGLVPVSGRGSHFKAKGETTGSTAAVFSSLVFHYEEGEEI